MYVIAIWLAVEVDRKANSGRGAKQITVSGKGLYYCR